jgi:hypothetical protein
MKAHIDRMLLELHKLGLPEGERPDVWVLGSELASQGERVKFQAWTCESILYAMREIALSPGKSRCNWRVVVRCYGQARQYLGRTGGFPVSCYVNNALDALQLALEDKVVSRG